MLLLFLIKISYTEYLNLMLQLNMFDILSVQIASHEIEEEGQGNERLKN